jgi:hypothetical protein
MTTMLIINAVLCIVVLAATMALIGWAIRTSDHDRVGEAVEPPRDVRRVRPSAPARERRRAAALRPSRLAG